MNGVDAIVFTAGIGENAFYLRDEILSPMSWFGIELDKALNEKTLGYLGFEGKISSEHSKVPVFVIPTDEELMIARDVERLSK
jgi:acetate kinase